MSLLKDSKKQRLKNSAKLPKLTIQQQIDNNEVIQRMNRKIAFTKNQRHLGSTITYNQALTSTHKQFNHTGVKTLTGSKFKSVPQRIVYNHYELHRVYEAQIKLINESQHLQRIKITPLSKKEFNIYSVNYPKEDSGDIAPGMAVTITIRFRPINLGDLEEELVVIYNGGIIKVPIVAMRERPSIFWPKIIDCGHCWVGNLKEQTLTLENSGGQAEYHLLGVNNQTLGQQIPTHRKGFFHVTPTVLKFHKQGKQQIHIKFSPEQKGNFTQTVTFKSNQGEQQEIDIKLKGGAYKAQIILQKINGQLLKNHSIENNLYINGTEVNKISHAQVTIHNLAVVDVDYFWFIDSPLANDKHEGKSVIEISNPKGKLTASMEANFQISFLPQNRQSQNIRAELYLFNLPEKSLINKSHVKIINGVQAIQCLVLNIKTRPTESNVTVSPLHKQANAKIYKSVPITEHFTIINSSSSQRHYKITPISTTEHCRSQLISQSSGKLQTSQIKTVEFSFEINQLTKEQQRAYFLVQFDNCPSKVVSCGGFVEYPKIKFSDTKMYFGLCKTYTKIRKELTLYNEQGSSVNFKVINPLKFYELQFYEFYDFDEELAEQFKRKRLTIRQKVSEKEINQDCQYQISRHSQLTLILEYNTASSKKVQQQIFIQTVDGPLVSIPIILQIQQIQCEISRNEINLRQIYKGNVYNSNKFLSKQLSVVNNSNVQTTFQFEEPSQETCLIKIEPRKFTLQPKAKKRIDLIIQPVKTGRWGQQINWKYYDDFKLNPQNYPALSHVSYNQHFDDYSPHFIRHQTLTIKAQIKGVEIKYYIKDDTRVKRVRQKTQELATSVKHSTMSFKSSKTNFHQQEKLIYPSLEELNFYNCEINQVRQMEIIIENDSGLTAEFNIYAETYHTLEKIQTINKNHHALQDQEAFTSQMGKTFLHTRKLDKSQKVHLSNNKGISVMCDPPSGILHKKQTQKIVITMFNDTSGRFRDNLVIDIKDHQQRKFPIDIHVKGTPVLLSRNQLGINFNQEVPVMNLGCVLVGNGQVKKSIKVVNKGPKQVNLVWKTYPYNKRNPDQDIFKLQFGEPAPGTSDIVQVKWHATQPQQDKKSPFILEPRQKTLQGRQETSFTLIVNQLSQLGKYQNLLICEPQLRDSQRRVKMQNLAVIVETQCVQPILKIDAQHPNQINMFELFATQHVHKQKQTSAYNHLRKIKLKNQQKVNLDFHVSIESKNPQIQSFKFVSIHTNSPGNLYDPNKTFVSGKKYSLTFDSFVQVVVELKANKKDQKDWPLEPRVRKDGTLKIKFSNGQEQKIPLVGWLYRPWIQVQMPNNLLYSIENTLIDFGTIHVKNSKKLSIYLINQSKSDSQFTINYIKYQQSKKINFQKSLWTPEDYEDQTITDIKQCFLLSQDSGVVLNNSIPVHYMPGTLALPSKQDQYTQTHKPVKIDFLFKPKTNVLYKSKFRIAVEDGLYYDIVVRGRGSFEQELQVK